MQLETLSISVNEPTEHISAVSRKRRERTRTKEKGHRLCACAPRLSAAASSTRSYGAPAGINRDVWKCLLTSEKMLAIDSNVPFTVDLHPPWSSE